MAHNILALWAELVPDAGPMTVADLLALPEDNQWQYEVVEGRLVRIPASGFEASNIVADILGELRALASCARSPSRAGLGASQGLTARTA